jgi:hypothetical protein
LWPQYLKASEKTLLIYRNIYWARLCYLGN